MEKFKEKLRMLVKPIEFAVMVGLPILGFFFGAINITFAIAIPVAYVVLQLTGWGVKHVQDAIDGGKDVVADLKNEIVALKSKIKELESKL